MVFVLVQPQQRTEFGVLSELLKSSYSFVFLFDHGAARQVFPEVSTEEGER